MPYELIIIPFIIGILAQILKLITGDSIKGNFNIANILVRYSGMPSGHISFIASLGTLLALKDGIDSSIFAIWIIFAIVLTRDALGVRHEVGLHSSVINKISKKINIDIPKLTTRIGHKPTEVMAGFLFGAVITLVIKLLTSQI